MHRESARFFRVQSSQADYWGNMRIAALFDSMQDIATEHAAMFGAGRDDLLQRGAAWVLSRVQVRIARMPRIGERFRLRTHTGAVRKLAFPRWFWFYTEEGEELASAVTVWFTVEMETHKVVSPRGLGVPMDDADPENALALPSRIFDPETLCSAGERRAAYSDVDSNGHVNNARYVEWACDALPYACFSQGSLRAFSIAYRAEAKPGESVQLRYAEEAGRFFVCGDSGAERIFEAEGEF